MATNQSANQSIFKPKTQTIVKRTYSKKKVLNLSMAKPQRDKESNQTELRSANCNNNSSNVKNRNQKSILQKVKSLQTSQSKTIEGNGASDDAKNKDESSSRLS